MTDNQTLPPIGSGMLDNLQQAPQAAQHPSQGGNDGNTPNAAPAGATGPAPDWLEQQRQRNPHLTPEVAHSEAEADRLKALAVVAVEGTKHLELQLDVEKIKLEQEKVKATRGAGSRGGAHVSPAIGPGGLRILTDRELPSVEAQRWIVKHIIPDTGIGVLFGDSGTFKSFVALDLLAAVATGRERWFGHRVRQVPCIYVPYEGKGGVPKRVEAWRLARLMQQVQSDPNHPVFPINFDVTTGISFIVDAMSLRTKEDRDKLVEALTAAGLAGGVLCIDTLAQAGGGIDENSSEGMGEMITAFQDLQSRLGGVVLSTHHTGKDASKGMRGHSSLRAAVDFAIECSRSGSGKYDAQMRMDKVKDEQDGAVLPFTMRRVAIGVDEDGETITSLIVVEPPSSAGNMPEVVSTAGNYAQEADDDEFIYEWTKREVKLGNYPSQNSLCSQLAEMKSERSMTQKRVREAVHRLKAASRLLVAEEKSPANTQWLHTDDHMPT